MGQKENDFQRQERGAPELLLLSPWQAAGTAEPEQQCFIHEPFMGRFSAAVGVCVFYPAAGRQLPC